MYDVLDVAKYVLYYARKHDYGMSVLQLMKILYFVQAQFLVSKKKRAFPDDIVALDWGPMERKVWAKYGVYGNANIPVLLGANFAEEEKIYTNAVAKIYTEDAWLIGVIVLECIPLCCIQMKSRKIYWQPCMITMRLQRMVNINITMHTKKP